MIILKQYIKNIWKNYVNTNDPGSFVTAEKMNNIENGIDEVTSSLDSIEGNLGISGARPQGNTPVIKSIRISESISSYILTISGESSETHLTLILKMNDNTDIGFVSFIVDSEKFISQVSVPLAELGSQIGFKIKCNLKNTFDEEESNTILADVPLP